MEDVESPADAARQAPPIEMSKIDNLETARMALRWALERLGLSDKRCVESEARAAALEQELAAAKSLLAGRDLESERLSETLVHGLKRRLVLAEEAARRAHAVIESREAMLTERERAWLQEKQDLLTARDEAAKSAERAWEAQRTELREELRQARRKAETQLPALLELERRAAEAEEAAAQSQAALESHKSILAEAERLCERQRAELGGRIRELEGAGAHLAQETLRHAAAVWSEEKAQLLGEVELWREKARHQLTAVLELERKAAVQSVRDAWAAERAQLQVELEACHKRSREQLSRLASLEERINAMAAGYARR